MRNFPIGNKFALTQGLEVLFHILFWTSGIILMYWYFGSKMELMYNVSGDVQTYVYTAEEALYFLLTGTLIKIPFFYYNALKLLPFSIVKRGYQKYLIQITFLLLCGVLIELSIAHFFIYSGISSFRFLLLNPFIGANLFSWLFYFGVSVSYGLLKRWQKNEQQRQLLKQEKLQTELNFLKFQINPHFLFNTLNNLFSIAQKHKISELEQGISGLATMMRYMIYESNVEQVRLETEVKYLQDFIEIQQLQFDEDDELIINFKIQGDMTGKFIAPMLFIPFVENAFKHGIDISKHSIIQIMLIIEDGNMKFSVRNTVHNTCSSLKIKTKGIGLANVKRRLELLYPERYTLMISEEKDTFESILTIPLTELVVGLD
ncbi:hypothetical protein GTQ34_12070 [Muricauda sp. JGD-17]|uniref:Signal transduction histidine kinase internal region domain-containing protein n=1 Tax=Flagellimonas ochracea TaxID=2696472 RepID=A0A964TD29_9FLAO|nr:histidine kinase [Allomuricauda ochracea]NAY92655.1 hypothetical protein [Allomuricauda ochracea]